MEKTNPESANTLPPAFIDRAWERREREAGLKEDDKATGHEDMQHVPAHRDFRVKYFAGFEKGQDTA